MDTEKPPRVLNESEIAGLFESVAQVMTPRNVTEMSDRIRERAAVLGTFRVEDVAKDLQADTDLELALDNVLHDASVVTEGGERRWMLEPGPRSKTLENLGSRAVDVLETVSPADDPLSGILSRLLRDEPVNVADLDTITLRLVVNAATWSRAVSRTANENLTGWRQELQSRELLDPLRNVIGGRFVGREKEMKQLRDHVNIVRPTDPFDGWSRWLSFALSLGSSPILVIHGIGGVGKSTLMAEFILEHAAVSGERSFPFVYLDFDRPSIDPANPMTLIQDATRQLGMQFPASMEGLDDLRRGFSDLMQQSRVEQRSGASLTSSLGSKSEIGTVQRASRDLIEFLEKAGLGNRPFLLVLDTFEEVQDQGDAAVRGVFDLLSALSEMKQLRCVISGRAPVVGQPNVKNVPLGNLTRSAALQLLEGKLSPGMAVKVYERVGGSPLSLRLASQVARDNGLQALDFDQKFDDALIQGYLYTRLLDRITNPELKTLVNPGLVVRRITPAIIRSVMAPVVGLDVPSDEKARELYLSLRGEMTLVEEERGGLVLRRDVRAVMLALQRREDEKKPSSERIVPRLNQRAIEYYQKLGELTPEDREELAYHELMLGEEPFAVLGRIPPPVVRGLGSAVDELPGRASVAIRVVLGRTLSQKEIQGLSDEAWVVHVARKAIELIDRGSPDASLKLTTGRSQMENNPLLEYPRSLANFQLLKWAQAEESLKRLADPGVQPRTRLPFQSIEPEDLAIRPWVELGYLHWYRYQDQKALSAFEQSLERLTDSMRSALRVECLLGSAVVLGQSERARGLQARLSRETPRLTVDDWARDLPTLRRLVFLGFADDDCARVALQQFGLRLRSTRQIERFMREFGDELGTRIAAGLKGSLAGGSNAAESHQRQATARARSTLEKDAAASLARSTARDLGRRTIPFLRGRYSAWRVPIRTALTQVLVDARQFLASRYPELGSDASGFLNWPRKTGSTEYIDSAIELAEDDDQVNALLESAYDSSRRVGPQHDELLRALERYSNPDRRGENVVA